jgi:hypothetical protein
MFNELQNRIVCAANLYSVNGEDTIVLGVRHHCSLMNQNISNLGKEVEKGIQGFVDKFGKFHTRTEAWKIAEAAGQIVRRVGGDTLKGGTLFSENLY